MVLTWYRYFNVNDGLNNQQNLSRCVDKQKVVHHTQLPFLVVSVAFSVSKTKYMFVLLTISFISPTVNSIKKQVIGLAFSFGIFLTPGLPLKTIFLSGSGGKARTQKEAITNAELIYDVNIELRHNLYDVICNYVIRGMEAEKNEQ